MKITEEMENIIHSILDDKIKDGTFIIHNINVLTNYLRQLSGYRIFVLMCNNHIIFDIGRYYDDIEDFFGVMLHGINIHILSTVKEDNLWNVKVVWLNGMGSQMKI